MQVMKREIWENHRKTRNRFVHENLFKKVIVIRHSL